MFPLNQVVRTRNIRRLLLRRTTASVLQYERVLIDPKGRNFPSLLPRFTLLGPFSEDLSRARHRVRLSAINRRIPTRIPLIGVPLNGRRHSRVIGQFITFVVGVKGNRRPLTVHREKTNSTSNVIHNGVSFKELQRQRHSAPPSLVIGAPVPNGI